MSVDDDVEFRDLISQTLEMNGCLSKIRAQLRASIFLTLDENEEIQQKEPLLNKPVKDCLETFEGRIMFCIVREFLEFFNLDCTLSIFDAESYHGRCYSYGGRCQIIENLGILEENFDGPLLLQLISIIKSLMQDSKSSSLRSESSFKNDTSDVYENVHHSDTKTIKPELDSTNVINKTYKVILPDMSVDISGSSLNTSSADTVPQKNKVVEPEGGKEDNSLINKKCVDDSTELKHNTQPLEVKEDKSDSSRSEKGKQKCTTSSLSDLPPLQISKSKNTESQLLPSLYSIGRDKSYIKGNDKLLEESFDSSSEESGHNPPDSVSNISKSSQSNTSKLPSTINKTDLDGTPYSSHFSNESDFHFTGISANKDDNDDKKIVLGTDQEDTSSSSDQLNEKDYA